MNDTPVFRSRAGLGLIIGIGVLVVAGLVRSVSPPEPQDGPAGSSYATHGAGTAALATLLERNGFEVARMRTPMSEASLGFGDVVVLINSGGLDGEDTAALTDFVSAGGRFVSIASNLTGFVDSSPRRFTTTDLPARSLLAIGGLGDVRNVLPERVWQDPGSMLPLIGNEEGTLVGLEYVDAGVVVGIADAGIVGNRQLDRDDNALLALEAIGNTEGTVWFVEYVHGFTQPTGLNALPWRWKQALLLLAAAGIVWLIARGKRFGPVEQVGRALPPPRSAYVDALALTLESGRDPDAVAVLDDAIARELRRRNIQPNTEDAIEVAIASGVARTTAETAFGASRSVQTVQAKSELLSHLINKEQL